MASGMLQSERRWTSRKSGMTVLGKVPKPINLPSQKLENHGLDPNVEIVPKGTLTWGTRPFLAVSSAWGSSTLSSPLADVSSGSPIHADGRPSSGGSGTRPSTGSSERSSEPATISWGPSSRPSSASGPSSHISVAVNRPPSAETRPNSSHLSRFAESSSDSTAWTASGNFEKPAVDLSKGGFTLSSGDFPSLGSDKLDETKSQGQSPKGPTSDSRLTSSLEGTSESFLSSGNPCTSLHENVNTWNADTHARAGDDALTRTGNWPNDNLNAQPLYDLNMPTQQYRPWLGPAPHANIVWYGGHDAGSTYRLPFGPPGGFCVRPFYPCVSAGALSNTQAFPRTKAVTSGVHFMNGELYGNIPPESYITHDLSDIPVRPGAYPGPHFFEGCYGSPILTGFDNPSELDISSVEMSGQHVIQNHHLSENPLLQPWRFHPQPEGSHSVIIKHMTSDHANKSQGQYKVLLKQHENQEEKDTHEKENSGTVELITHRGNLHGLSRPDPDLLENNYKPAKSTDKQHGEAFNSKHFNNLVVYNDRHSLEYIKFADHNITKKPDLASGHLSSQQTANWKKNANLMEKVECLNTKSRVVNAQFEGENYLTTEKKINQNLNGIHQFEKGDSRSSRICSDVPISCKNVGTSQLNASTKAIVHEPELKHIRHQSDELAIVSSKTIFSADNENFLSHNQKRSRNMKGRVDHQHGNLKHGSYCTDELKDSLDKTGKTTEKSECLLPVSCTNASQEVTVDQNFYPNVTSASALISLKSVDHDIQHAKLKELARQRALELHKEEEARTSEQKAKAHAKLDELNRRTSTSLKQNLRLAHSPSNDIFNKDDIISVIDANDTIASNTHHDSLDHDFQMKNHLTGGNISKPVDSSDISLIQSSETSDSIQPCVLVGEQSRKVGRELFLESNIISRRKQEGYRRRRNITDERNQAEKYNNTENCGSTRYASMIPEESLGGIEIINSDDSSLVQSSNKNNHASKYRNKMGDTQLNSPLPFSTLPECTFDKSDADNDEIKSQEKFVEYVPVSKMSLNEPMRGDSIDSISASKLAICNLTKLTAEKPSNNSKPQSHKKSARSMQSDKASAKYQGSETAVWAPVIAKAVVKDGISEVYRSSASKVTTPDGKDGQDVHNVAKARRAEMERYVPKPIAKELSMQGGSLQSSPPVASGLTADKIGKNELASKTHPSWRQRNSDKSSLHEQNALESYEHSNSVEKLSELKHSGPNNEFHAESSKDLHKEPIASFGIVKHDSIITPKRQQFKQKADGGISYAPQSKHQHDEMLDKRAMQCQVPVEVIERNPTRNEIHNTCSRHFRSHWQPKSQVHSQNYMHGCKDSGGRNVSDHLLDSQPIYKSFNDSSSVDQKKSIDAHDPKYHHGYQEREAMKNNQKNLESTRERREYKQLSKNHNPVFESKPPSNANTHQLHIGGSRCGHQHGNFPSRGDATYADSEKDLSVGDGRNAVQHFECQTDFTKNGNIFQQNSSASEVTSEAPMVSSGSSYGSEARNHTKRGGHFYGPRRGASTRVSRHQRLTEEDN